MAEAHLEAVHCGEFGSGEAGLAGAAQQLQLTLVRRDDSHTAPQASTVALQPCMPTRLSAQQPGQAPDTGGSLV